MDQQISFCLAAHQMKDEEFASPGDVEDFVIADPGYEFAWTGLGDCSLPAQVALTMVEPRRRRRRSRTAVSTSGSSGMASGGDFK
jgi:hypothetical protein